MDSRGRRWDDFGGKTKLCYGRRFTRSVRDPPLPGRHTSVRLTTAAAVCDLHAGTVRCARGRAVAPARPVATKSYSLHYIHKRMVGVYMLSTLLVGLDWLVVQLYTLGPKRPLLYWAISSTSSQTGARVLPMNLISFWSCKNGWIDDWSCTVRAFFAHRSHASPLYVGLLLFFLSIATCI
jgi:hypothetical protein